MGAGFEISWTVGVRFTAEARDFSSPQHPDWLWSPPSLPSNGNRRLFPWWYSGRSMKLTTNLHLVLRSRMVRLYLHSPHVLKAQYLINQPQE
jgi:hypothetical protein